jgi:hypothetical protein
LLSQNYHVGNHRFRLQADEYSERYHTAARKEKAAIVKELVDTWRGRDPPGRFLIRTDPAKGESSLWHDVGEDMATKKAAKTLSERSVEFRTGKKRDAGSLAHPAQTRSFPQLHPQAESQVREQAEALIHIFDKAQHFPQLLQIPQFRSQPQLELIQQRQLRQLSQPGNIPGGMLVGPLSQECPIAMSGQPLNSQIPGTGFSHRQEFEFVKAAADVARRHPSDDERKMQDGPGRGLSMLGSANHTTRRRKSPAGSCRGDGETHPGATVDYPETFDDARAGEGQNVPTAASLCGVFNSSEGSNVTSNKSDSSDET